MAVHEIAHATNQGERGLVLASTEGGPVRQLGIIGRNRGEKPSKPPIATDTVAIPIRGSGAVRKLLILGLFVLLVSYVWLLIDYADLSIFMAFLFLIVWLLMAPIARYVLVGWDIKRREIFDNFDAKSKILYLRKFSKLTTTEQDVDEHFDRLYNDRYGRKFYITPSIIVLLVSSGLAILVVNFFTRLEQHHLVRLEREAVFGVAGGYLWVVSDFISRSRRRDLSPADIMWGALRLIIAVPLGYAFSALGAQADFSEKSSTSFGVISARWSDIFLTFIPFALGAFPLNDILQSLRKVATRLLKLDPASGDMHENPLFRLQGITKDVNDRLIAEDITTIGQLAYCDPVQLAMRSNLSFTFVVDIVSQALIWQYVGDRIVAARPYGIRTSFEVITLVNRLRYDGAEPGRERRAAQANALLGELSKIMRVEEEGLRFVFETVSEDPYAIFLYEVWNWH